MVTVMSATGVDLVEFVVPIMLGFVFFVISLTYLRSDHLYDLLAGLIFAGFGGLCFFFTAPIWIALEDTPMFASVSLLWYGLGAVCFPVLFTVYIFLMLINYTSPKRRQDQILTLR